MSENRKGYKFRKWDEVGGAVETEIEYVLCIDCIFLREFFLLCRPNSQEQSIHQRCPQIPPSKEERLSRSVVFFILVS